MKSGRLKHSLINYAKNELINYFAEKEKAANIYHVDIFNQKNKIYFMFSYVIPNKHASDFNYKSKLACFNKRTRYMYFQNDIQKTSQDNLKCKIRSKNKFRIEFY